MSLKLLYNDLKLLKDFERAYNEPKRVKKN